MTDAPAPALPPGFLRSVSREEVNALPIGRYEGEIVMVESNRDFDRAWEDLASESSIGWDTETRPAFRVGESYSPSLVQAATARAVYVFPLARMDFSPVLGGLFARPREATWKVKPPQAFFATDFLTKMYKRTPGVRSKFNAIALHPYSSRYQLLRPNIEEVRAVLKANRDLRKRIWITELGWSTQKPDPRRNAFAKGVAGQVRELRGSFSMLRKNQVRWRIGGVYWFSLEDGPEAACNFCSGAGLFASGFVPKPSWTAYARFAGGRP